MDRGFAQAKKNMRDMALIFFFTEKKPPPFFLAEWTVITIRAVT